MALTPRYCRLLSNPTKSHIVNYLAADTTVVAGLGVKMDTDGNIVRAESATTTIIGIALNTPSTALDVVAVLVKGKLQIIDDGEANYIATCPATTKALVYQTVTGTWSTSGLAVGYVSKRNSATDIEIELNMETASVQPSA